MSPEAQFFISAEERETWCVSTVHSSLRSRCHPLYMKVFSSFWFVTGAPFKKKTKQKQTKKTLTNAQVCRRRGDDSALRGWCHSAVTIGSCFFIVQWDLTGSPRRSGVPRTQGAGPPPHLNYKKKHLQQQSSCVLYQKLSRMCVVFPKKQYLVSSICTAEPRVCACIPDPRQRRSVFAVFPSPWFFYRCYQMQRCWPF